MLRKVLVLAVASLVLSAGAATAAAGAATPYRPPPPVDYQAQVVATFNSSVGEVLYRRGWWYAETANQGFGFDKIYHKHNIKDKNIVGAVVQNPGTTSDEGGGRYVYTGAWQWRQCDVDGNCVVKDQRTVRVVVDYAPWSLAPARGMLGINTAYCQGDLQCPEWINQLGVGSVRGSVVAYVGKGS